MCRMPRSVIPNIAVAFSPVPTGSPIPTRLSVVEIGSRNLDFGKNTSQKFRGKRKSDKLTSDHCGFYLTVKFALVRLGSVLIAPFRAVPYYITGGVKI